MVATVYYGKTKEGSFGYIGVTPLEPYQHQSYPAHRYKVASDGSYELRVVDTEAEDLKLGPEWTDSPAKKGGDQPQEKAPSADELEQFRAWKAAQTFSAPRTTEVQFDGAGAGGPGGEVKRGPGRPPKAA